MTGPDRFHRWGFLAAVLLGVAAIVVALSGCSAPREENQGGEGTTVGETLVFIGRWFTYAGAAALGIGLLGRVACLVFPTIAFLAEFLGDIAVVGLASLLLGTSFIWLGNHAWLLAIVVGLLLVLIGLRYRVRIARFLGFKKTKASEPSPVKV